MVELVSTWITGSYSLFKIAVLAEKDCLLANLHLLKDFVKTLSCDVSKFAGIAISLRLAAYRILLVRLRFFGGQINIGIASLKYAKTL